MTAAAAATATTATDHNDGDSIMTTVGVLDDDNNVGGGEGGVAGTVLTVTVGPFLRAGVGRRHAAPAAGVSVVADVVCPLRRAASGVGGVFLVAHARVTVAALLGLRVASCLLVPWVVLPKPVALRGVNRQFVAVSIAVAGSALFFFQRQFH